MKLLLQVVQKLSNSCQKVVKTLSRPRTILAQHRQNHRTNTQNEEEWTKNGTVLLWWMLGIRRPYATSSHLVKTYLDNMYLCLYTRCAVSPRSIFENVVHKHIVISNRVSGGTVTVSVCYSVSWLISRDRRQEGGDRAAVLNCTNCTNGTNGTNGTTNGTNGTTNGTNGITNGTNGRKMAVDNWKNNFGSYKHLIKITNDIKWITNCTNGTTNGTNGCK
jgi:hypothetical protein